MLAVPSPPRNRKIAAPQRCPIALRAASTTSRGEANMRSTMACSVSPVTGSISIASFSASARNSGSLSVCSKARRSAATRASGTCGGAAHGLLGQDQLKRRPRARVAGELGCERNLRQLRVLGGGELNRNVDFLVADPVGLGCLDGTPAPATARIRLAPFERESEIVDARIAGNDLEPSAD